MMTTRHSPLRVLKAQADLVARHLVAFERGEVLDPQFAAQMEATRQQESIKIAVVMDDKTVTLDLSWKVIRASGEVALSEYILKLMREQRDDS